MRSPFRQRWPDIIPPGQADCESLTVATDRFFDQRSVMNRFTMAKPCATISPAVATIRTPRISITTFSLQTNRKCSTDRWGASRRAVL